jgi:hypothetical protein
MNVLIAQTNNGKVHQTLPAKNTHHINGKKKICLECVTVFGATTYLEVQVHQQSFYLKKKRTPKTKSCKKVCKLSFNSIKVNSETNV